MTTVYADAYGFNPTDATTALQAAIDSGADKIIVRNQNTPWLISSTIQLRSKQEIRFEENVVVKAKSGSFLSNTEPLFQALDINTIKLVGEGVGVNQATLAMNKNEFTITDNSYGHIIGIRGTDNYIVSGLTLTGAGGDGIIIDAYSYGQPDPTPNKLNYSDNGLIDNVTAINNRRNGLSIISAQNLTVQNSKFINTSDENPANGIDVEPDFSYNRLSNITIKNVDLSDNQGHGIGLITSALDNNSTPISINIDGATINRNGATGIKIGAYEAPNYPNSNNPNSTANGVINISNVTIAGTKGTTSFYNDPNAAISIEALSGDLTDPNNVKINFSNIAISDTGFNAANPELSAEPIFIRGFGGTNNRNEIGNVSFDNVTVADNFDRAIIGIYLNQPGSLNNITANIRGINPNGVTSYVTPETTTETRQNFKLTVTPAVSPVVGTSGNDTFNPGKGAIAIDGGTGNDTLILDNSADTTDTTIDYLNTSNGTITAGFNHGMIFKNIESITFKSGSGIANVNVSATAGNNNITGGQSTDSITGGAGNDTIFGGAGTDTIDGGAGDDTIQGGFGQDTLDGGAGNDTVNYTTFNGTGIYNLTAGTAILTGAFTEQMLNFESILAGSGNDTITGTADANTLNGGAGNDTIFGGAGTDTIDGGAGDDTIQGGFGQDTLDGGAGNDTVNYTTFNGTGIYNLTAGTAFLTGAFTETMLNFENIIAGGGNDTISGNAGANTLNGGGGNDTLTGGAGNDNFYFGGAAISATNTLGSSLGNDTITDFTPGQDKIVLSLAAFTNITAGGGLSFASVANDDAAALSSAEIVYNQTSHLLSYKNPAVGAPLTEVGSGGAFVTVNLGAAGFNLTAGDFTVVA